MNTKFYESDRFKVAPLCPCGRSNQDGKFTPLVVEGMIEPKYGYCHSCGNTFFPNNPTKVKPSIQNLLVQPKIDLKFVDKELVNRTLKSYHLNNFALKLKANYPLKANYLLDYFAIGTTKDGGTIFWYQDRNGNYRKPKRIFYKPDGHRIKTCEDAQKGTPSPISFTNQNGYEYCLYGEFQLATYPETAKIILVESEKTAVVGHAHFPEFIWMATGGATSLKREKAIVLKDRKVIIIPDMDQPGREGGKKMQEVTNGLNCQVVLLELDKHRNDGGDIVDILVNS